MAEEVVGKGRFAYVTGLDRHLVSLFLCINKNSFEKQYRKTKSFMTSEVRRKPHHICYFALIKTVHLFSLMKALEQHLLLQDHSYFSKPEDFHKTSDKVKILFIQKLKDVTTAERNYLISSIGK